MTAVTRPREAVITDPEEFSLLWPRLFDRVVSTLRQRGVDWASAEDAVQEAGARALARGIPYTSEGDLRRWVLTVAWRVAVDNHRRTARWRAPRGADSASGPASSSDAERAAGPGAQVISIDTAASSSPGPGVSATDVASEVEARIELRAVERMFPLLSAADRAALLDAAPPGQTRKEAVRAAVRRHRARARLVALVEGLASALGFLPIRRLGAWRAAIVPSVAAAVLVPLVLVGPPLGGGASSGEQGRDSRVRAGILVHATSNRPPAAPLTAGGGDATRSTGGRGDDGDRHHDHAAAPSASGTGAGGGLSIRAAIPGPPGEADQGDAGVRPSDQGKPLLCVWAPTAGKVCTPERQVADTPLPPPGP